ncbi:STAS domain-containing protein [Streptomyces sp. NPDC050504]|uniref:STAS domain-containing protein n=1 Tax=Streptomyces sp. NPDC050504 TaxID=3365618 RepID=UPI00379F6AAA
MVWSAPAPRLRLAVSRADDHTVLHVAGELDTLAVPALEHALHGLETPTGRVELDLSRVTFCSLAGVELLVSAHRRAAAAGASLTVRRAHSAVAHTMRLCRVPSGLRAPAPNGHRDEHAYARDLLRDALALALRITGAPMGNAQLYDPEAGALRIVAQRGFHQPFLSYFETVQDRESACGVALQDQSGVFVEEVAASPVFLGTPALDVLREAGVGGVASVPVAAPGGVRLGVISVHRPLAGHWTDEQRATLGSLARATGSAWHDLRHQTGRGLARVALPLPPPLPSPRSGAVGGADR